MDSGAGLEGESPEAMLRAGKGDAQLLSSLLARYRPRLARMVRLRIDRRLRGRIDQSDVIQEAYFEAAQRLPEFVKDAQVPFYQWLRFLVLQRVALAHRRHLRVRARDASREAIQGGAVPGVVSTALAAGLVGKLTSPSAAAAKAEIKEKLLEALEKMDAVDREILALRHFEQLSNVEAAQVLGLKPTATSNRYVRALERLRASLDADARPDSSR